MATKVRSFVQFSRAIRIASAEAAQLISPWGRYLSYFRFRHVVEAANSTSDLTMIPDRTLGPARIRSFMVS